MIFSQKGWDGHDLNKEIKNFYNISSNISLKQGEGHELIDIIILKKYFFLFIYIKFLKKNPYFLMSVHSPVRKLSAEKMKVGTLK